MIRFLISIILLSLSLLVKAQATDLVVDNQTPGWLSSKINFSDQRTIKNLKVTGYINSTDLVFIKNLMKNYSLNGVLDLSESYMVGDDSNKDNHFDGRSFFKDEPWDGNYKISLDKLILPRSVVESVEIGYMFHSIDTVVYDCSDNKITNDLLHGYSEQFINNIIFGENVDSVVKLKVGHNIESIKLPKSLKYIGNDAFGNYIHKINISEMPSLEFLGNFAFVDTDKKNKNPELLPDTINLPKIKTFFINAFDYKEDMHIFLGEDIQQIHYKIYQAYSSTWAPSLDKVYFHLKTLTPPTLICYSLSNSPALVYPSGITFCVPKGFDTKAYSHHKATYNFIEEDIPLEQIVLNPNDLILEKGEKAEITASFIPKIASDTTIVWSSDDNNIATVSQEGLVTAISSGETNIYARSIEGAICAFIKVIVNAHAESVSLFPTSIEFANIGDSSQLNADIIPDNSINKSVIWNTSNKNVCTVSSSGLITATGTGTAVITVTTIDGGHSASCLVKVIQHVSNVDLNKNVCTLRVGESYTFTTTVSPNDAEDKSVLWSSSNSQIAQVDDNGKVFALKAGEVWIKVVSVDNSEAKDSCKVIVTQPVNSISLSYESYTFTNLGESLQLTATVFPINATNNRIQWSSSDEKVCTVNMGLVTAVGSGTATIMATTVDGGFVANCSVTVANKYLVTYIIDGQVYKTYEKAYGTSFTPEAIPEREGYTFSGWSVIPEMMPAHDVEISGSFSKNSYILVYEVDGNEYKKSSVEFGTPLNPEAIPEREGYTFSGWSVIPEMMPAHDVVVTGLFSINSYTLIYEVDGQEYKKRTIEYGTALTPEFISEREGYTFSGWSEIPKTMPAHEVIITGSFSPNKYYLTYVVDDETFKTEEVEFGTGITPEAEATREGYTFSGWSEIPEMMPAHDVEVTGSFSVNSYTLIYIVEGNEYKTSSVEYGTALTPESILEREGYTFSGWSDIPEIMPARNVTVTGSFAINQYNVTYLVDNEVYKTERIDYGSAINPPVVPTINGFTFAWESYPEALPANDLTIIGTYIVISKSIDVEAKRSTSAVMEAVGDEDADELGKLIIKGTINGYDVMAMRNRMPYLQFLDLSEAKVVSNSYKYYENYVTKDDVLTAYFVPEGIKTISLPKNLKSIDGNAFRNCSQLTEIILPDNITSIGDHTFDGCSALKNVKIPTSVASIGEYAFKGCSDLKEIHLPSYLETIGDYAFEGCNALKDVYALMFDIVPIGQHTFNDYRHQTLHVPEFLRFKYVWDARWSQFLNIETMELNPGDYERLTTNTDTQMGEEDQRIPHKDDGEAIDARIQREGSFTVEGDEPQDFATVELVNDGEGRSGSLIGDDDGEEQGNVVVDDLVYRVSVEAETEFQYTPPVDLNIDEDFEYPEGQYKWWYFDGSDRARLGSSGRKPLDGKILKAHQGYVFMAQRTGILIIHLGKTAVGGDRTTELQDYEAEDAQNQGWNFMGNPYASYYDMSECTNTSPVTIWNAAQLIYEALRPGDDDFYLQPFQSFYVQKQDEVKGLKFDAVSRKSYRKSVEEKEERRALRRAKGVNPERRFIDLYIEVSGQQADHTRLVANASAKAEYEIGVDAAKFMSEKAAAQIYTLESGVEMAINERPLSGSLPLGYTAAKAGRLTIGASRMDAPLVLVDRQTGVTCDLSENAYEFTTTEGTFNDRFLIRAQGDDGIGALTEKTGVLIAIREGGLAVGGAEGKEIQVYSIDGKAVASQSDNGFISLKPNIYIVGVDGITAKIRIRK